MGRIYRGGLTGISDHTLDSFLELPPNPLNQTPPHGSERAVQLALATREKLRVDYALAITPRSSLEDDPQSAEAPVAHFALAAPQGVVEVREINLAGDPAIAEARLTKSALNLLRLHLRDR
jgi:nicotinamide mononucleotide (NMN) deamidase PncC